MAISKIMRAALKALSYPDIDVKNNYKIERKVINVSHHHFLKCCYKTWDHKITYQDHDIPVRIFYPNNENHHSVLLFFHGGGWVTGNIDSYNKVCTNMAKLTNHIVVSVDYRLAPEYRFPAGLEDCYAVAKEIFLNSKLLDIEVDEITLIGDSAGGNLAAALSLMARDRGEFTISRQILIYPATYFDHTEKSPFASVVENGTDFLLTSKRICDYMDLYINSKDDYKNPYFAPLIATDLSNQPDTLIITAEFDPLRDEGEMYGKKLKRAGNNVKIFRIYDALHGFISLPSSFPQVKYGYQLINRFLNRQF